MVEKGHELTQRFRGAAIWLLRKLGTVVKWGFILLAVSISSVVVLIVCGAAISFYLLRYEHKPGQFNEKDRAVVESIRKSPTGSAEAMRDSLTPFVDRPVLTDCDWTVYRYRASVVNLSGKPDKFTVFCKLEVKQCITDSRLLRPYVSNWPGDAYCLVYFTWYYTEDSGVYRSEWENAES